MRCGGYSLVEVMAAAFVLAVGVTGACASQAVSLRTGHDAALATRAVHLAASLGERMRANTAAMAAGDAANPYLRFDHAAISGAAPAGVSCHAPASCDPAQLAQADLSEAAQELARYFPGGRLRVCRDAQAWAAGGMPWHCTGSPAAPVVVKVGWQARGGRAGAAMPRVVLLVPGVRP